MSKSYLLKPTILFWMFTGLVAAFLFLPQLLNEGMFFDGLAYSTIAANLAEGEGTLWRPILSQSMWNPFYGHPPLVMYIESLFFRVLGDGWFTERWYGLFVMLASMLMIHLIWKECFPQFKKLSWLPVFLWLITPGIYTFYARNLLEPTMGLFTLLSILLFLKSTKTVQKSNQYFLLFLSATCILAAFLCKGFPGLFPLAMPFIFEITVGKRDFKKAVFNNIVFVSIFGVICLVFFSFEGPRSAIFSYLQTQVFGSISGDLGTHRDGHLHIIWVFFEDAMYMTFICLALAFWSKKKFSLNDGFGFSPIAIFFVLISVSAAFPVAFSPKQSSFYILACFAPLALGVAGLKAKTINRLFERISAKSNFQLVFESLVFLMLAGAIILNFNQYKKPRPRDAEMIADVKRIHAHVGTGENIGSVHGTFKEVTSIHVYLQRYGNIDLDTQALEKNFIIHTIDSPNPLGWQEVELGLTTCKLFQSQNKLKQD